MLERQRRRWCRLAFLSLCMLPTTVVLGWSAARRTASYIEAQADALSRQLGAPARFDRLSHPRPGARLFHGLEWSDRETGTTLLRCRLLEIDDTSRGLVLAASQAELYAGRIEPWVEMLVGQMRRERSPDEAVRWVAGEATWHGPRQAHTLTFVRGSLGPAANGAEAEMTFCLAGGSPTAPANLRLARQRQGSEMIWALAVQTGDVALPGDLLTPVFDAVSWLGPRASFRGNLWARQSAAGWHGEATGEIVDIDLAQLVQSRFPHHLTGDAALRIERLRFDANRVTEVAGTITAGPGTIGRSLVAAGAQHLELAAPSSAPLESVVPYVRLAADFVIDPSGLRLTGRVGHDGRGALLVDGQRVLWQQPDRQPQPTAALVRMLVPHGGVQAPYTRQSDWLLRALPLPPPVPAEEPAPRAILRIGEPIP